MRRITFILVMFLGAAPLLAQTATPAAKLWDALMEGNKRYVGGKLIYADLIAQRKEVVDEQEPDITIISCADSRVPPELIFDKSVGDLFVVRMAGNVVDDFGLASVEYAVLKGWTDLIVVLGHESCGAVKAALEQNDPDTPSLRFLVQRIRASFTGIGWDPDDKDVLRRAVELNARSSAAYLPARSGAIRAAIHAGKVKVMSAYYSLETGAVTKIE